MNTRVLRFALCRLNDLGSPHPTFRLMPTIVNELYLIQLEWLSLFNEFTFIPRYGLPFPTPNTLVVVTYHSHKCVCTPGWDEKFYLEATLPGSRLGSASSHMSIRYMYRSREKSWDSLILDRSSDRFAHHYYAYTPGYLAPKASQDLLVVRLPKRVYYTRPLRGHWLLLRATTQRMSNAKLRTSLRSY